MSDPKWNEYWRLCKTGDFDAALAEADRVAPPGNILGMPRVFYLASMARNHIEEALRNREAN